MNSNGSNGGNDAGRAAQSLSQAARGQRLPISDLPERLRRECDQIIERFEEAWQADQRPEIAPFLPEGNPLRLTVLRELVHIDFEYRSDAGEAVDPETYLSRFPELNSDPGLVQSLAAAKQRPGAPGAGAGRSSESPGNVSSVADGSLASMVAQPYPTHDPGPADVGHTAGGVEISRSSVDRFRIVRPHAKGGLGQVSVAVDRELRREVALKEIQPRYADNPKSRNRFVREAEITGTLEHPGIVPVYGLGTDASGRPYYAMRFIQGESLNDAIADLHASPTGKPARSPTDRSLVFRRLLQRFIVVCEAIQYAHDRGVLHRDLKPANIMLGKYGETLVVDWGLAKRYKGDAPTVKETDEEPSRPATGHSSDTLPGLPFGTPAYMSPEQAAGRLEALGPASDIYSLGATLYHLLTGAPPYQGDTRSDVVRKAQRGTWTPARHQNRHVPRPLEAICGKAMALQPAARYPSAKALAHDIEAWMADERVTAARETWNERIARFGRKHRGYVRAGGVAVVLIAVLAVIAVLLINSAREEALELAGKNERLARDKGELADSNAILADEKGEQAEIANARFELALSAFNQLVFDVQDQLQNKPGVRDLRKSLLDTAVDGLSKLLQDVEQRGRGDRITAIAISRLGDILLQIDGQAATAADHYHRAHVILGKLAAADPNDPTAQRDLSISFERLGSVKLKLGQTEAALGSFQEALEINRKLAEADPSDAQALRGLSISYNWLGEVMLRLGQSGAALQYHQEALEIRLKLAETDPNNAQAQRDLAISYEKLGNVTMMQDGQTQAALQIFEKALEIDRKLAEADPSDTAAQSSLSIIYEKMGDATLQPGQMEARLQYFKEALEIRRKLADSDPRNAEAQRALSVSYGRIGEATLELGQTEAAQRYFEKDLEIDRKLAEADPQNGQAQRDLSLSLQRLGDVTLLLGQTQSAIKFHQESLEICRKRAEADARDVEAQRDLSICYNNFGSVRRRLGQPQVALEYYQKAMGIGHTLVEADPLDAKTQIALLDSCTRIGDLTSDLGQAEAALQAYQEALEIGRKLVEADPRNAKAQRNLSVCYGNLGNVTLELGQTEPALQYFEDALEIDRKLAEADPSDAQAQRSLSISYNNLGKVTLQVGQAKSALEFHQKALDISQKLSAADSRDTQAQRDMLFTCTKLGEVMLELGQLEASRQFHRDALEIGRMLADADPDNAQAQDDLSISYARLGEVTLRLGEAEAGLQFHKESLKISRKLAEAAPDNAEAQRALLRSYGRLGNAMRELGQTEAALETYQFGLQVARKLVEIDPHNAQAQSHLYYNCFGSLAMTERQRYEFAKARALYEEGLRGLKSFVERQQHNDFADELQDFQKCIDFCTSREKALNDIEFAMAQPKLDSVLLLLTRVEALLYRVKQAGCSARPECWKQLVQAAETAEKMKSVEAGNADYIYTAACAFAFCVEAIDTVKLAEEKTRQAAGAGSKETAKLRQIYLDQALAALKEAIAAGYADFEHMRTDPDLVPLHVLPAFQQLVKGKSLVP